MKAPHMLSKAVGLVAAKSHACQLAKEKSKLPADLERALDYLQGKTYSPLMNLWEKGERKATRQ